VDPTNLFRPWLLARVLAGVSSGALCVGALWVALKVLRRWRLNASSEGQLALERRAELVATLVQAGLVASAMGLVLTVLGAERTARSIRGAMCAYGVLDATSWGFLSLALTATTTVFCGVWLVVHRLDLRLETPALTRRKFGALFVLAPLLVADLGLFLAHALTLDLGVVATCCSTSLDHGTLATWGAGGSGSATWFYAGLGLAAAAAVTLFVQRRRPGRLALVASLLSLLAFAAMLPAVLLFVAPHAYETPQHLCPFCLLQGDVGFVGWPLFGALFAGLVLGLGSGMVELLRRDAGEHALHAERALGRWGGVAWLVCVLVAAAPVIRYAAVSGGASLFP